MLRESRYGQSERDPTLRCLQGCWKLTKQVVPVVQVFGLPCWAKLIIDLLEVLCDYNHWRASLSALTDCAQWLITITSDMIMGALATSVTRHPARVWWQSHFSRAYARLARLAIRTVVICTSSSRCSMCDQSLEHTCLEISAREESRNNYPPWPWNQARNNWLWLQRYRSFSSGYLKNGYLNTICRFWASLGVHQQQKKWIMTVIVQLIEPFSCAEGQEITPRNQRSRSFFGSKIPCLQIREDEHWRLPPTRNLGPSIPRRCQEKSKPILLFCLQKKNNCKKKQKYPHFVSCFVSGRIHAAGASVARWRRFFSGAVIAVANSWRGWSAVSTDWLHRHFLPWYTTQYFSVWIRVYLIFACKVICFFLHDVVF